MIYKELIELLNTRRSVRKFLPDPVPVEDIEKMIAAAGAAPSGNNKQNWRFIAVTSEKVRNQMIEEIKGTIEEFASRIESARAKDEFKAYTKYYTFFTQAPLVICAVKTPYDSLTSRIMDRYNLPHERRSSADTQGPAAAIQNLLLAAHSLGYGACWMTGPMIARFELEKVLGIEPPDQLIAIIPAGKPAAKPDSPKKKDVKEIYNIL